MKKLFLLFALIISVTLQAQTYPVNPQKFGKISINENVESTTATKISVQEDDNRINWLRPIDIPITKVPVHSSPTAQTLGGILDGIDSALGQAQTTAGQTARVYLTADPVTVNSNPYFLSSITGKGTVTAGSPTPLVLGDNVKAFFNKDVISILQPVLVTYPSGTYAGQLTVSATPTPNATQQRFTVEIYKTDLNGVPIASGIAGAPIGALGVAVVTTLDSGIVNLVAGAISNVSVSGTLLAQLTVNPNERIRYHVSAAKIGAGGGNVTFNVYYGSNYNSYYDVPVPITTDGVIDRSDIPAVDVTGALNYLNANKENVSNKATDFSVVNNTLYPTVQGVKTYADGLLVGLWNDRGNYTIVSSQYPTTGGSGTAGAIIKGNAWQITGLGAGVSGTIGTKTVNDGDVVRALVNSPAQLDANWAIAENNIGFTPENLANKSSSFTASSTDTYANTKALVDGLATKQTTLTNPITGIGTISYIPIFTTSGALGNSLISQSGSIVSIVGAISLDGGTGDSSLFNSEYRMLRHSSTGNSLEGKIVLEDTGSSTAYGNMLFKVKTTASSSSSEGFFTTAIFIKGTNANVLIGSTTDNGSKLQVNGTATAAPATVDTQLATLGQAKSIRPFKVCTFLVTQTGTNAPTAIFLENTIGANPTLSRAFTGDYYATFSGTPLTTDKTVVINSGFYTPANCFIKSTRASSTVARVLTINAAGSTADGILENTLIEIRVYQ